MVSSLPTGLRSRERGLFFIIFLKKGIDKPAGKWYTISRKNKGDINHDY